MRMDKSDKLAVAFMVVVVIVAVGFGIFQITTDNAKVKMFGGTHEITLDAGQKLVTMTWKENDLWLQTRNMRPGEYAEVHRFSEQSSLGIFEGTIVIHESAPASE